MTVANQGALMTVKECAKILGCGTTYVRCQIDAGLWKFGRAYTRPGRKYKTYEINRAAFMRFVRGE